MKIILWTFSSLLVAFFSLAQGNILKTEFFSKKNALSLMKLTPKSKHQPIYNPSVAESNLNNATFTIKKNNEAKIVPPKHGGAPHKEPKPAKTVPSDTKHQGMNEDQHPILNKTTTKISMPQHEQMSNKHNPPRRLNNKINKSIPNVLPSQKVAPLEANKNHEVNALKNVTKIDEKPSPKGSNEEEPNNEPRLNLTTSVVVLSTIEICQTTPANILLPIITTEKLHLLDKNISTTKENIPAEEENISAEEENVSAEEENVSAEEENVSAEEENVSAEEEEINLKETKKKTETNINIESNKNPNLVITKLFSPKLPTKKNAKKEPSKNIKGEVLIKPQKKAPIKNATNKKNSVKSATEELIDVESPKKVKDPKEKTVSSKPKVVIANKNKISTVHVDNKIKKKNKITQQKNHDKEETKEMKISQPKSLKSQSQAKAKLAEIKTNQHANEKPDTLDTSIAKKPNSSTNSIIIICAILIAAALIITVVGVYSRKVNLEYQRYDGRMVVPTSEEDLSLFNRETYTQPYHDNIGPYESWNQFQA